VKNVFRVVIAVAIVFVASNLLVHNTVILGNFIGISPYILSILVLSIGTNVPEITIAIRAVVERKSDVALGDYLGSASLNTLELGILSLINRKSVSAEGSNFSIVAFLVGLCLFVYFGKSKSSISRWEGFGLLAMYAIFVVCELITGPGWTF
jgi:cation:H+ antiporter